MGNKLEGIWMNDVGNHCQAALICVCISGGRKDAEMLPLPYVFLFIYLCSYLNANALLQKTLAFVKEMSHV